MSSKIASVATAKLIDTLMQICGNHGVLSIGASTFKRFVNDSRDLGYGDYSYSDTSLASYIQKQLFGNPVFPHKVACIIAMEARHLASDCNWGNYPPQLPAGIDGLNESCLRDLASAAKAAHAQYLIDSAKAEQNKKEKTVTDKDNSKSLKTRALSATKKAAKKAVVRKVSRHLTKGAVTLVSNQLAAHPMFAALAAGPLGTAGASAMLAVLFEFAPLPEAIREQFAPFKDALVEEFTIRAIDEGTQPLEEMVIALLPTLTEALPMLASGGANMLQIAASASVAEVKS